MADEAAAKEADAAVKARVATLQAALGGPVVSSITPAADTRFVRQPSATARY